MEREDGIPVLQPVKRRDRVPVMEMQDIEFFFLIELGELVHHLVAHILTILHGIATLRPTVMVRNVIDCLICHTSTGEKVHVVILCKGLGKVRGGTCKSPHPLGIHRFPAEKCYVKRLHNSSLRSFNRVMSS